MKSIIVVCVCVLIGATEAALHEQSLPWKRPENINDDARAEKERRSTKLSFLNELGSAMLVKGTRASSKLLEGAEHTSTHGFTREFQKTGGVDEAFHDFMALNIKGARNFRSWDGSRGKVGQVGDRTIKLISRNAEGKPAIEITKIETTLTPTKTIRDVITYDNKNSP